MLHIEIAVSRHKAKAPHGAKQNEIFLNIRLIEIDSHLVSRVRSFIMVGYF